MSNDQIRQILDTVTNFDLTEASAYTDAVVRDIVAAQRKFFRTGATLPVSWRIKQLKRLKAEVLAHEKEFEDAFGDDEALNRLWPNLKDSAIVAFFQSEVWTAGDVYCSKKLSGETDIQAETEWGEVECRSANGYAERRLRCVQD